MRKLDDIRFRFSKSSILVALLTILTFLDLRPFFVWKQNNPTVYRVYNVMIVVSVLYMAFLMFWKKVTIARNVDLEKRNHISLGLFLWSFLIVGLFFYYVYGSGVVGGTVQPFNVAMLLIYIGLMLYCLQDEVVLAKVFRYVKAIFAITLIPSIITFILLMFGISLPSTHLMADAGKELTGQTYYLFWGSSVFLSSRGGLLIRLCGMYTEPGFVGTIGTLFLVGDKFRLKKWDNIIILVALFCTFSVAFILMLVIGVLLTELKNIRSSKKAVRTVGAFLFIIAVYAVFMNLSFPKDSALENVQSRLVISEEGLSGDDRMKEESTVEYEKFLKSGFRTVMLGHGNCDLVVSGTKMSIWQNSASYKESVYSYGVIGFFGLVLWLILATYFKFRDAPVNNRWNVFVLLVVFILSMYQRPGVSYFYYFLLLFGGGANCALDGTASLAKKGKE